MNKGILLSLTASVLFGGMYYISTLLLPLSGDDVFGVRMLTTLPFLFLTLLLLRQTRQFFDFLARLKREPYLLLVLLVTSALVGCQMWLFLYVANVGKALELSFGYLILPIALAAVGKLVYKEHLSHFKWAAILLATVGVVSNIYLAGRFSWEAVSVFVCYPLYFMLRRRFGMSHIHSFIVEIILLIPISLYFVADIDFNAVEQANPNIYFALFILAITSGTALLSYTLASSILPFNLLGLLGYVEPFLMMSISFLIGQVLSPDTYILMICLLLAISCLVLDGLNAMRKQRRRGV